MIEVAPNLYVGNAIDYERNIKGKHGWAVVHAAKEPYHRQACGYVGPSMPDKTNPEYLFAYRGNRMCLNMIDSPKPGFFRPEMIDAALEFITKSLAEGFNVLVHCNLGGSRAPSLALLWLRKHGDMSPAVSFEDAEEDYRLLYPSYDPAPGIREYVRNAW